MTERCPHCGSTSPAFEGLSEAVLQMTSEQRSLDRVLKTMAHVARRLARARYAAIGIPDEEGGFEKFVASGITAKQWDAIGDLPRQHGLLGAMLDRPTSFRSLNIQDDPRFEGWPDAHPRMRSLLGVPVVLRGRVVGAFYVTDKKGPRGSTFSEEDERLIEALAAHAAVAIENARLFERSRELSVVEERNRLARELHDAVNQTLFSATLTAEAAAMLVDSDPAEAKRQLRALQELTRAAIDEMRSLIFELRPADLGADGLVATLGKHVDVLRRVHGKKLELSVEGEPQLDATIEREVFRIAQEALANALTHGAPECVEVQLQMPDSALRLRVTDDGTGFDPNVRDVRRRLGLVSMRERAEAIGGRLEIDSSPGVGTTVTLEVPLD